jgi:ABC-type branched-subunit amino acid transport system ATPase component/ABC-type branched-subunit amino acid transport system permease subunit
VMNLKALNPKRHGPMALLLAVAALWVFAAPGYWVFTAATGVTLGVAALGLLVVVGWAKEVSLAQAGLTGTAVYLCAYAMRGGTAGWGWPFIPAALFAIAITVAISLVISLATAKLSGIYIMILTLAVQFTIERTFFTTRRLVQTDPRYPLSRPALMGIHLTSDRAYYVFALAVLCALMVFLSRLRSSRFGRALLLTGTDRQAASSVGVSPFRAKIFAFAIAGFCAGLAGVLIAPLYPTPPTYIGFVALQSLIYLAIPVLAGFRSIVGVAAVAMGFAVAPQALEHYHLSPFFLGAVGLIGGTLVGSAGLSGVVFDLIESRRSRAAHEARDGDVDLREVLGSTSGQGPKSSALHVVEDYLPHERVDEGDILVADKVSVAFGGLKALDEVSIRVPARHLVGLIGPNGAGKSTTLHAIMGLASVHSGDVRLAGSSIRGQTPESVARAGIALVPEGRRIYADLSVEENLRLGLAGRRSRKGAEADLAWVRTLFPIVEQFRRRAAGALSGGQQQQLAIARALVAEPDVLMLDEPSLGLAPLVVATIFRILRGLNEEEGLAVLLVEQNATLALESSSRAYVLETGRVALAGAANELRADESLHKSYLGY